MLNFQKRRVARKRVCHCLQNRLVWLFVFCIKRLCQAECGKKSSCFSERNQLIPYSSLILMLIERISRLS